MTKKIIRIATRQSPLALWQAEHTAHLLKQRFNHIDTVLVKMLTRGDKLLDSPLNKIGGKGLFVKELEQGMLAGEADIAVHSMKDVPMVLPDGLHLAAILPREDPRDAFVSVKYAQLSDLPAYAKIGTSSLRRQCQLKALFPTAEILPLRGNVNTRLAKLAAGEYDAIILASAGLIRLGMRDHISHYLAPELSLPACGQGAIGIESRVDDVEINALLAKLHHEPTGWCVQAERAMNQRLNGGCQVPIAGFAELQGEQLTLRGLVGSADGAIIYRAERSSVKQHAETIGQQLAEELLAQGANKILAELINMDSEG